ncbi:MAG: chemotaxis protein CheW [Hyphomicrobiales bacterium]|nr:chemotaxis protein CheW [Hyphomicrobiales bacterium]
MSQSAVLRQPLERAMSEGARNCFIVNAGGCMFGVPVDAVQAIFRIQSITPAPLGPRVVLGLVNLRGKIVVAVSLAQRLGLDGAHERGSFGVAIDSAGESYALVVDSVGDAVLCEAENRVQRPPHIAGERAAATSEYYRLEKGILPVLNLDALFDIRAARKGPADNTTLEPSEKGAHP